MLPCTTELFSSGVPTMRLLEAKFGKSDRTTVIMKRPLASTIMEPFRIGTVRQGLVRALAGRERDERPRSDELLLGGPCRLPHHTVLRKARNGSAEPFPSTLDLLGRPIILQKCHSGQLSDMARLPRADPRR